MSFSSSGVKLPDHLRVGGRELLATNPVDPCALEGLIGIGVFPALSIIAGDVGTGRDSSAELLLDGPAVAQVEVLYEVDFECGGPQKASGSSLFTMFPVGRIMREDRMVIPGTTTLDRTSDPCGCESGGGTNFFFTSFYGFSEVADAASHVDREGNPTDGGEPACTLFEDAAVGVAWDGNATRVHPRVGEVSAHIFDFKSDQTLLSVEPVGTRSAIQVIAGDPGTGAGCANILAQLVASPMTIAGNPVPRDPSDGIYRDEVPHRDAFAIEGSSGLPAGFAVSLDLAGATHAEITRSPAVAGEVAIIQRDGERFIFLFPDALGGNERITIEPRF
jgi:hypothetical protein